MALRARVVGGPGVPGGGLEVTVGQAGAPARVRLPI
eukprot:COSAG01_NODE_70338_length_259_cov_0.437500_1_plen_35_part_01